MFLSLQPDVTKQEFVSLGAGGVDPRWWEPGSGAVPGALGSLLSEAGGERVPGMYVLQAQIRTERVQGGSLHGEVSMENQWKGPCGPLKTRTGRDKQRNPTLLGPSRTQVMQQDDVGWKRQRLHPASCTWLRLHQFPVVWA